jgi:hypothetical protein
MIIAFYPEVQQKLYEEVKRVWPNGPPSLGATSVGLLFVLTAYSSRYWKQVYKDDFNKLVSIHPHADTHPN